LKIVAIIEARMGSRRLPGKIMRPILGKPMLELLIERLKRSQRLDEIIVATTENPLDDVVENLTQRLSISCFRGSENDVLDRVLRAARSVNADIIVEITGDCPLIDPNIVDDLIDIYLANKFDYVSNILQWTFPDGFDTQIFSTAVLEKVEQLTQDPSDREHVSLFIYTHPEYFTLHNVESPLPEYWNLKFSVDTLEDFNVISSIFKELYPKNPTFGLYDVIDLVKRNHELNKMIRRIPPKQIS
jgi:spore coat polysaccharide biosynthesis protein SpsF